MDADFVIVGGGIAGVSLAAELAQYGSVTVLEGEAALGHHASGRSAAMYEPHYGAPPVVELSLASGDALRAMEGVLSPRGLMVVAGKGERAAFDRDVEVMQFRVVSVEEARAAVPILNPETVAAAGMSDHAWDVDTDRMLQGYASTAKSKGAQIVTGAKVTGIVRDSKGWRLIWAGGTCRAGIVVNASGAWVDQVARMAGLDPLGFTPMRRSMARIPAPGGQDVSKWPMIFGAGETWYAKPDAGALIVSPADEDPKGPHDAWADDMVIAEGMARYEAMVTEPVTRVLKTWAGLRTFSKDRVPVIGFDPREPKFFWLAGQGGYGFQTAPAMARHAACILGGQPPEVPQDLADALSPARFHR